jgi:hypothetical protein
MKYIAGKPMREAWSSLGEDNDDNDEKDIWARKIETLNLDLLETQSHKISSLDLPNEGF